ncbi:tyrosinase [Streptomyces minutiscleroticus]|uniref:Tyrosinase n=1 Tax=Streptomyces minutiscleroticus TaxID=68238 RepID=A0A918KJX5_9ACTN|nr:tyrosinase [Streptomyces minutiscleroticus]
MAVDDAPEPVGPEDGTETGPGDGTGPGPGDSTRAVPPARDGTRRALLRGAVRGMGATALAGALVPLTAHPWPPQATPRPSPDGKARAVGTTQADDGPSPDGDPQPDGDSRPDGDLSFDEVYRGHRIRGVPAAVLAPSPAPAPAPGAARAAAPAPAHDGGRDGHGEHDRHDGHDGHGGHGGGRDASRGGAWYVTVDGRPLHLMRRADGGYLTMLDHYQSYPTPLAATRAAVDELGASLRLHPPGARAEGNPHGVHA